ncbi:sigma-70 family RNA polymerase sigma factor [Spirosoma rhododendri]|uniref:Sigma-70 family RNA polymerase sigma factor n=1 Tax=Spirosoma rhododendri TaxID=2728024 RepID=A0A7L5DRD6_9BACT|nr:sigma-70 family RNA polymerase sigma factor [Spirosoma rhododendri]QJD79783.1 sigma-70 family RNA polymerase sigma factor [Spirosoma rhododendri]
MTVNVETALLRDLSQGDLAAFDALYGHYQQPVYANILKLVKQAETAEDILQEVFIALWENRHKIDTTKSVGGWLFVVSHNKALSVVRKKVRESVVVQWEADLSNVPANDDRLDDELFGLQMALIEEAVEHLPARKRDVFRRCRFEGQSTEEVAQQTGISVASVNDYLKQSTRFIREYIRTRTNPSQLAAVAGLLLFLD